MRPQTATRIGLEHLSGFEPEFLRGGAEGLIQRVVFEFGLRQDFSCALQDFERHGGIALLRDQFGGVVGRKLVDEEKVGGGEDVAQKLDALADERGDGSIFSGVMWKSGAAHDR